MVLTGAHSGGAIVARQRHLPNAPITEALIDIRVAAKEGLTFQRLKAAFEAADFGYYVKNAITEGTFEFKLSADEQPPETRAEAAQIGLRMHSQDERYVAQCQLQGFTLSRLPPYEDWSRLLSEARRAWARYVELLEPKRVTRVATRFINNLRLPLAPGASFQTYLNKLVDVPDETPQTVEAFFQRFQLVDGKSGARVVLTAALDAKTRGQTVPVLLDVDAFMSTDVGPADPEVWVMLGRLHDLKNECFFGSITERAAELYE